MKLKPAFEENLYRVKREDTLESIAELFGVGARLIATANRGAELHEGMLLWVPKAPSVVHRVMPNETLEEIASRYGTSPEAILRLNGITRIFTGLDLAVLR